MKAYVTVRKKIHLYYETTEPYTKEKYTCEANRISVWNKTQIDIGLSLY